MRWLWRECINESDFTCCIEPCTRSPHTCPNEHGLEIRESILRNEKNIGRVGGLHLIVVWFLENFNGFAYTSSMHQLLCEYSKLKRAGSYDAVVCKMIKVHRA